jgi:hypothetical protein
LTGHLSAFYFAHQLFGWFNSSTYGHGSSTFSSGFNFASDYCAKTWLENLEKNKEKYNLSAAGIKSLAKTVNLEKVLEVLKEEKIVEPKATWETIPFYKPKSANEEEGYSGRIGIHEILKITPTIQEMIIAGKPAEEIEKQARAEGMMTMLEDGIYKAVRGVTTIEEVLRVVSE